MPLDTYSGFYSATEGYEKQEVNEKTRNMLEERDNHAELPVRQKDNK